MRTIRELKKPIRAFMQAQYTDERLAQLLCHARDGKLSYASCCCFIGVSTADHALQSWQEDPDVAQPHIRVARSLPLAHVAEVAFRDLVKTWWIEGDSDLCRQRILIPMIRAEMKRREKLRAAPRAEEKTLAESAPSLVAQG